ncbi:MAG: SDR family oxidoreductase [Anaerolineaceae bacterium]|nr:SDR family oxidoreductase [Anaerolineaceae bacterium]MBN2677233.1 SDR family oxidoreductase [Anaerolineaceae bacterium]
MVTGSTRRIGRALALTFAHAGWDIILHHGHSAIEAEAVKNEIESLGRVAAILKADLADLKRVAGLVEQAFNIGNLYAIVNNAAVFEDLDVNSTTITNWQLHMDVNLTAPFLLSQNFANILPLDQKGRILNILDWRALRPGADHLPYTVSKAALAALTRSLAAALAPRISVNGLALGAVLPPADGGSAEKVLAFSPISRWVTLEEVCQSALFLITGPETITGEIIHVDGGRHLI